MIQIELSNPSFESCIKCIHSDDSEETCILRRCIHAVAQLKECYVPKKPTIEPQQKWIPCSERMPEAGQKCLVCEKGTIAIDTYIGKGKPYDWRWYVRDYDAWMPLPEPYREEGE